MELLKLIGTNSIEHWVNPLKIIRVTFSPEHQEAIPPPATFPPPDLPPEPEMITIPATLTVHLEGGFAVQVPDDLATLVDKLDKVG